MNIERMSDQEIFEALQNLLPNLTGSASGIARQLLAQENFNLTEKQRFILNRDIIPSLTDTCGSSGCNNTVPSGTGFCSTCALHLGEDVHYTEPNDLDSNESSLNEKMVKAMKGEPDPLNED